jgi:Ca-activated chloride channel family protein
MLIFLTDGLPTTGEVDADRIIDNVGDAAPESARIFPFGVGYDVNTLLLDTIAENHRGASGYVRPEESIDEQVSAFYAKVSTPLLADLEIDFGRIRVEDLYPYPLPDLFAGTQLVLVGRYRQGGDATVTLHGKVNSVPQSFFYDDMHFRREGGAEFIARLWATRKIGYLLQQVRLHGEERELIDEIVDLSVRYGIITPYTSFLVEETEMALREEGREVLAEEAAAQATEMPLPASGELAVERSVEEKGLSQADAPVAPSLSPGLGGGLTDEHGYETSPVRYVGDKTFILHDGVWIDTTFDADSMLPVPLGFGSDDYFALVAAHPEWGRYFALGNRVIVVLEGTAYEIGEGQARMPQAPTLEASPEEVHEGESASLPPTPDGTPQSVAEAVLQSVERLVAALADFLVR